MAKYYFLLDLYKALFAYETDKEDELTLSLGETIYVTNKDNADWWLAERLDHKEFGLVPSNVSKLPIIIVI
jgi:hypothetical protein